MPAHGERIDYCHLPQEARDGQQYQPRCMGFSLNGHPPAPRVIYITLTLHMHDYTDMEFARTYCMTLLAIATAGQQIGCDTLVL